MVVSHCALHIAAELVFCIIGKRKKHKSRKTKETIALFEYRVTNCVGVLLERQALICAYVENEGKLRFVLPLGIHEWIKVEFMRINKKLLSEQNIIASPSRDVESYLSSDRPFLGVMIRQMERFLTILRQFGCCLIKIASYFCRGQPKRSASSKKSTPVGFKRSKILKTGFGN